MDATTNIQILTIDAVGGKFRLTVDGGMTADIDYDPTNPVGVASAIESAINTLSPGTVSSVTESGATFLVTFADPTNHDPMIVELSSIADEFLTRVSADIDASDTQEQVLSIRGNAGSFTLSLNGGVEKTAVIDFSPDDPAVILAKVIETELNLLLGLGSVSVAGAGGRPHLFFERGRRDDDRGISESVRRDRSQSSGR